MARSTLLFTQVLSLLIWGTAHGFQDAPPPVVDIVGSCDFNGLRFYGSDCQRFLQCSPPYLYLMSCSTGSFFSEREQKCFYLTERDCFEELGLSVSTSTSTVPTTTLETSPPPASTTSTTETPALCSPDCSPATCNMEYETWPAPDVGCEYFFECASNCTCLYQCDDGLWFDEAMGFCNFAPLVSTCSQEEIIVGAKALAHAQILTDRTSLLRPKCNKVDPGECDNDIRAVWDAVSLEYRFEACSNGWRCVLQCSHGYIFDVTENSCVSQYS